MTAPELTPMEHRILAQGRVVHCDWTNVAWGSPGGVVVGLVERGLMEQKREPVPAGDRMAQFNALRYLYDVTRAGRDAYLSYGRPYVPVTEASQ